MSAARRRAAYEQPKPAARVSARGHSRIPALGFTSNSNDLPSARPTIRLGRAPRYFHTPPIDEILATLLEHYAHSSAHAEGRLKMCYDER